MNTMTLPTLDEIVLKSLDFFVHTPPPVLDLSDNTMPFVVGSGNALSTGKVLFSGKAAIFADESNFQSTTAAYDQAIKKGLINSTVIISASGEKDSVWESELSKKLGLKTTLLTCKPNSTAAKIADRVVSYKSIAEPYTYNTSTYLGMILSKTRENPAEIKTYISQLVRPVGFDLYTSYAFILNDMFVNIAPMIMVKGDELFGPHVMIRAVAEGHARHAKFVHRWDKELVMSLGVVNKYFGDPAHRWGISLPSGANFGFVMAVTYYLCGLIQKAKPPYFMENVGAFCADYGPKAYDKPGEFSVIVPANE